MVSTYGGSRIYIDYKKAFDSVNHERLWDALERKGITGNFFKFLEVFI